MDQVAADAGVSKPVLYRYFADKAAAVAGGQRAWSRERVVAAVAPAVEQVREERALIEATIDAYLACIEASPSSTGSCVHQSGTPACQQLVTGTSRARSPPGWPG